MTLTASAVSSFTSSMDRWELAEYICAGLVTLACGGEFVAEFTDWFTRGIRTRKERLAKYSTLLLITALAAELICLVRTNQLSATVIASLNEKAEEAKTAALGFKSSIAGSNARAKTAEAQASEARKIAGAEQLERLKLEAIVSPRSLTLYEQRRIKEACGKFSGHRVDLRSYGMDGEGAALGGQIISALRPEITVLDNRATTMVVGGFALGVHIRGPDSESGFMSALSDALPKRLQVRINDSYPRQQGSALAMGAGGELRYLPGTVFVSILVGIKPVPILPAK